MGRFDHDEHHDDPEDDDRMLVRLIAREFSKIREEIAQFIVAQKKELLNELLINIRASHSDVISHLKFLQAHIDKGQKKIMATLEDVTTAVAAESTVGDSIVTLLNGINQQLKDLIASGAVDPAALQTIVDQITANTTKLSDAVTANTNTPPAV